MTRQVKVHVWSETSVGMVRESNEDSLFEGENRRAFAVADGMGGHQAGEVASAIALKPIAELDDQVFATPEEARLALRKAVIAANTSVFEEAAGDPGRRGMGTTLTALLLHEGRFHLAHVGDSRAYQLRADEPISQLTTDHTLVEELITQGRLSRDEADTHPQRSVITRAIGVDRSVEVDDDLPPQELLPGDQILLCSDGLTGPVKQEQIEHILAHSTDGREACEALIAAANAAGGPDNITVILLRIEGEVPAGGAGAARPRSGDTQDMGAQDVGAPLAGGASAGSVIAIDTLPREAEEFDAHKFGRYGERQGPEAHAPTIARPRGRRVALRVAGALLILAIAAAVGILGLSRAYYVGDQNGIVAIFRGLPEPVGGLALHQVLERTTVRTADLPANLQGQLRRGISMMDVTEARLYIEDTLKPEVEAETQRRDPATQPPSAASRSPLPSPGQSPQPSPPQTPLSPPATSAPSPARAQPVLR
ncbi:MAG: Stp1/IreP family PP2C-type Ser/Thr phosphatase [Egibacteraceae bacterium]